MELLSGCIQLLSYIIESEFESEMEKAKLNLSLDITPFKSLDREKCYEILNSLVKKVNSNLEHHKRSYLLKEI